VSLQWAGASVSGLTGYRVLRGGVPLADVDAGTTSYEDRTAPSGTDQTYAVALLRGAEQVPLTREATVRTTALAIDELRWSLPRVPGSTTVAPEADARFVLTAAPGFTATASVVVRTVDGATRTEQVVVPEQSAGSYVGTWRVPLGIASVQSAVVRLGDGAGTTWTGRSRDCRCRWRPAPPGRGGPRW
jgi:hypothetical protein